MRDVAGCQASGYSNINLMTDPELQILQPVEALGAYCALIRNIYTSQVQ